MTVVVEFTELEHCKHIEGIRTFKFKIIAKIYGWYKKKKGYDAYYE